MNPVNLYNIDYFLAVFLQDLLYDRRMYGKKRLEGAVSIKREVQAREPSQDKQDRSHQAHH
jgi:hypothetical protein